jgi:PAS domain-containing protein
MSRGANTVRLRESNTPAPNTSFAEQLRGTLNAVPTHAWYATPSGTLIFLNEKAADYGGLPKDHPLRLGIDTGAPWDAHIQFLHPDDHDETRRVWSSCLRRGNAGEVSFRARDAHGLYRWFVSRVEPTRASDGTLLYWTVGAGEGTVGPASAALANALRHVIGKPVRNLPLTRERVLQTL